MDKERKTLNLGYTIGMEYLILLTLLLAPTYAIRFNLFGLPTNVLMLWVFLVWVFFACWVILSGRFLDLVHWFASEARRTEVLLVFLFLLAGVISLFVGGVSQEKLGQFIVLFVQPIGTFFVAAYVWQSSNRGVMLSRLMLYAALVFVAIAGVYAIVQYFTLIGVPPAWWGNSTEPKRAVAFFLHPNFYALFITPLLAFLMPYISRRPQYMAEDEKLLSAFSSLLPAEKKKAKLISLYPLEITAWILGAIGLLFSLSRGGWFGLAISIAVYLLVAGNRRLIKSVLVVGAIAAIIVVSIPNFRYRLLLPFRGEKSSVARFSLWNTGWKMVEDAPVLGKGLLGFSNNWYAYNKDEGLEHYPAPHNIALNFWVDTGLLGLISFMGLLLLALRNGIRYKQDAHKLGLALACVALFSHGLIDIPYFKNDLALVFWILYSLV